MTDLVCVGLAVLDVVHRVDRPPVWGRKHVAVSTEMCAGGPATNAAICAARLLGSATLITGLGSGPAADTVRAELAEWNVDVHDIAPRGWSLPVASCVVDQSGERTVISSGALQTPFVLTGPAGDALERAEVLLLDGHHPAAAVTALDLARSRGVRTLLDAGSAKAHVEAWLPRIDVAAGSADYATGLGTDLAGAIRHVLAAGVEVAVMTDGPDAIQWATAKDPTATIRRCHPPHIEAVDSLGAGDAFHGALAAGLTVGMDLDVAIDAAARVAAKRVACRGARGWLDSLSRW
ncbi:Sulfofructose kinase [Austwickia sp. TVS 96-490-7B]|uniref:carbohydrate kinase family protein n=1 Tax=Austwickia sp. TVS 96-490-7B TaxID=2830843 RepID=UPI001C59833E|nr:PfkB family carbohydrate kinase [Austwickia sp. TVS 96-490-7B]MBW3086048.1 Sulfofructose kinase [Austwickia sp. TVS 96-490-7B]